MMLRSTNRMVITHNKERANHALETLLVAYPILDTDDALTDVLTDLLHYCDQNWINFEKHLAWAREHFACELRGEDT